MPLVTRPLSRTGLRVTELGFGGGPLGGFVGRPVDDDTAQATLQAAWEVGIRLFDTAPWYGLGASEHRIGHFLRSKPRDAYVVTTKVGRLLERPKVAGSPAPSFWANALPYDWRFDYSRDAVLRSYEGSLQRLGLAKVDLCYVHDLEPGAHGGEAGFAQRLAELEEKGGFAALEKLRETGEIKGIGIATNDASAATILVERLDVDAVLIAGRYTLLEQGALEHLLPTCQQRRIGVVLGGVFNSGVLAGGDLERGTYEYEPAPSEVVARVRRLTVVCEQHGVELAGAALRFPFGHPAICAVIPGAVHPEEVRQNASRFAAAIPAEFWQALRTEGLLAETVPTPAAESCPPRAQDTVSPL